MPEPYKSKWLFCNHCGSEQAAGANDRWDKLWCWWSVAVRLRPRRTNWRQQVTRKKEEPPAAVERVCWKDVNRTGVFVQTWHSYYFFASTSVNAHTHTWFFFSLLFSNVTPCLARAQCKEIQWFSSSVVTVSKCFLSVGFGRFCRKNLGFRFGLGFHNKRAVNFFMTRVIWHDFRYH